MTDRPIVLWLLKCLSVLFAFVLLSSCTTEHTKHTSAPIRGKIVDAVTKQPLAGVNVMVTWSVYSVTHKHFEGYLEVKEAVTNEKGEFLIEGWGLTENPFSGALTDDEPKMLIFKPWYQEKYLSNSPPDFSKAYDEIAPEQLGFYWDNKTIDLKPVDDHEKYVAFIGSLQTALIDIYHGKACDWTKAPRMILATSQFFKSLLNDGYQVSTMGISYIYRNEGCPTIESVFGEKYQ